VRGCRTPGRFEIESGTTAPTVERFLSWRLPLVGISTNDGVLDYCAVPSRERRRTLVELQVDRENTEELP